MAMFLNGWGNRVAITDSIHANLGLCYVSSMIILLQLMLIHLLCHLYELTDTLGLLFGVVNSIYEGGNFHEIIFPKYFQMIY